MLLNNYNVFNSHPGRAIGGPTDPTLWLKRSSLMALSVSDSADNARMRLTSVPHGYEPPYAWLPPIKGGAMVCQLGGSGDLSAGMAMGRACSVALSGSGDMVDSSLSLVVQLGVTLGGTGDLSANMVGVVGMSATMDGTGSLAADMSMLTGLSATLSGTSTITAALRGTLTMTASIEVSASSTLTEAGIAAAVWTQAIEAGYTAEQILRLLAAALAGSATGLEGANPQFTGLDGTTVRIDGSYSSGTRTIDALDVD